MTSPPPDRFDRSQGIGASEAGAVLGMSPFATPTDVWLNKRRGPVYLGDSEETAAMEWGSRLEPAILKKYEDVTGAFVVDDVWTRMHDRWPIFATPDSLVTFTVGDVDDNGLVDAKCTNYEEGWGEEGTDDIPDSYLIQGVVQMVAWDRPWVDFAVLFLSRRRFGIWRVERDIELEGLVMGRLSAWWERHVVGDTPPDPTDPQYLGTLKSNGAVIEATPEQRLLLAQYRGLSAQAGSIDLDRDMLKDDIKAEIGDFDGLSAPGIGKISWRTSKKTGKRRFHPTWEKR